MNHDRLPYFGRPPTRNPVLAAEAGALRGKRVILSTPDGFTYDVRAVSELIHHHEGDLVEVTSEEDYFRWMFTGHDPARTSYPARLVWLE